MTRRALLSMLALAAVDPERLIWRPGKKLISIPAPGKPVYFRLDTAGNALAGDITAFVVLDRFGNTLSTHAYPRGTRIHFLHPVRSSLFEAPRFLIGRVPPSPPQIPPGLRLWPGKSRMVTP